jgi:hypothetical protein
MAMCHVSAMAKKKRMWAERSSEKDHGREKNE